MEKNGMEKEKNFFSKLVFEGEYLDGKRWNGKGNDFDFISNLKFEGEYLNGKLNGKGKEYEDMKIMAI